MDSLDNILAGGSDSAPKEEQVTQAVTETTEGQTEQQAETTQTESGGQKMVPHEALHAEKQKVKRYTEEVADFRKQLSETNAAWERRMAQLVEAVKPKQEQPKPDFFENPEAATRAAAQDYVDPRLNDITQTLMANAQLVAGMKYGDEKVTEAEQAFIDAMQSRKLDPADYQRVISSPNRYAAAVQWHQRQQAQAEIGDDPAAFKAKVEAEILAKHGLTPETNGQQAARAPVMPSNLATARNVGNRSGPAWSGPKPLSDIFAR